MWDGSKGQNTYLCKVGITFQPFKPEKTLDDALPSSSSDFQSFVNRLNRLLKSTHAFCRSSLTNGFEIFWERYLGVGDSGRSDSSPDQWPSIFCSSRQSGILDSRMLRRGAVDHRTVGSPTFDEEGRHRTGIASTICEPGPIIAPRLAVQSRIEETKVEVLYEAYAVEKSLLRG